MGLSGGWLRRGRALLLIHGDVTPQNILISREGEVKLSIKALKDDGERNAYQAYRAQVKQEAKFGTFADLLAKKTSAPK